MNARHDPPDAAGREDELESYVTHAQRDPVFRAAYEAAGQRRGIISRLTALRRRRAGVPAVSQHDQQGNTIDE